MAARPSTPVEAAAIARAPLYDAPTMPTLPVDHVARTSSFPVALVNPRARPFSQSTTAFGASDSLEPPELGHPCDWPVPGDSECTTAKPRGTQVLTSEPEIIEPPPNAISLPAFRGGEAVSTSCSTDQNSVPPSMPLK